MKASSLFFAFVFCVASLFAQQQKSLPRGTVFGTKPNAVAMLNASELEAFMGKKTRISTTIKGKVIKVTKQKGGWFEVDGGNGRIITAHFKVYDISIPMNVQGRYVIAEGVAEKQFTADDGQHLAGGNKQHSVNVNPRQRITFEVTGLMVE